MPQPFYGSDLTDTKWDIICPIPSPSKSIGTQREVDLREILNAIFYRADNGIKWRALPYNFPPWQTVYDYYRAWVKLGVLEHINSVLVQQVRQAAG